MSAPSDFLQLMLSPIFHVLPWGQIWTRKVCQFLQPPDLRLYCSCSYILSFFFKICCCSLLPIPFTDSPRYLFMLLSGERHPIQGTCFILFVDANHLTVFTFRKLCLFVVQYLSTWGAFQFHASSYNTAVYFPSISPASYWVFLPHAVVLEAPQTSTDWLWLKDFLANINFVSILLQCHRNSQKTFWFWLNPRKQCGWW